jgi:hypothetical protein
MRTLLTLLAVTAVLGCASSGGTAGGDRNRITLEEVEATNQPTAYDIVRTLRPGWLRSRGPSSINAPVPIQVYVDGTRLGGPRTLQTVPKVAIEEILYYNPMEAQAKWGLNHTNGAIAVVTRRG